MPWVCELLERIEANQEEFNAGKFRGAVFQMNFIAKENLKVRLNQTFGQNNDRLSMKQSLERRASQARDGHGSVTLGRLWAGQSIREALTVNQSLNQSVNSALLNQTDNLESSGDGTVTSPTFHRQTANSVSRASGGPSILDQSLA